MGNSFKKEKNDPKIESYYAAMKNNKSFHIGHEEKEFRSEAYNWTLLHLAVWFLNKDRVEVLLKEGFDVNSCDVVVFIQHNETPLHIAAYQGNKQIYELLTKHGAREDMKNKVLISQDNKTPKDLNQSSTY